MDLWLSARCYAALHDPLSELRAELATLRPEAFGGGVGIQREREALLKDLHVGDDDDDGQGGHADGGRDGGAGGSGDEMAVDDGWADEDDAGRQAGATRRDWSTAAAAFFLFGETESGRVLFDRDNGRLWASRLERSPEYFKQRIRITHSTFAALYARVAQGLCVAGPPMVRWGGRVRMGVGRGLVTREAVGDAGRGRLGGMEAFTEAVQRVLGRGSRRVGGGGERVALLDLMGEE